MDLISLTIKEASELLRNREVSSVELTRAYLSEIEKQDNRLHAFLSVHREEALVEAEAADRRLREGEEHHVLTGIPGAIKDNILIKGLPSTAASKILEPYHATYDATVVAKLRAQHAVFLGKTNLDEFAMGSSTENSGFGPTKNPHDLSRVPGGSSGGSAAAVAANFCVWALGTDTGGSIRQPASFCGIVGLKPTYGAVSRHGLIAMASSLDQAGPLTKTVEDAAILFEAIAGPDSYDSTTSPRAQYAGLAEEIQNSKLKIQNLKIGFPHEYFAEGIDPAVEQAVRRAFQLFEALGAKVTEISLPHTEYALPCYYIIMPAEVSANLARYDGIKYGLSERRMKNEERRTLEQLYFATRGEGFGPEVRRRILLGTYVLSAGYYEAYYGRAQRVRRLVRQDFENAFKEVDIIVAPTAPTPPFKIGERSEDPLSMYLADIYTVSANLAGVPAISLPVTSHQSSVNQFPDQLTGRKAAGTDKLKTDLPIGLQIIGKHFDEKTILQAAYLFEQHEKHQTTNSKSQTIPKFQ